MTTHAWPGFRWPHLFKLTDALLKEPSWPSTDRWLAERFRIETKFGRKDRAFYSDALFRLCRQAAVPVFLQQRWDNQETAISSDDIWPQLQQMQPVQIWSWLVMIDRADSQLPREIQDAAEQRAWLDALPPQDSNTLNQLLSGWLPSWDIWLTERAHTSHWSDAEKSQWLELQHQRPPLWLRLAAGHEEAAVNSLTQDGFAPQTRQGRALAVIAQPGLEKTDAWQAGWIEIQDKASQAVVDAMSLNPGDRCWDVCAGAGGKALAMLDAVQPSGQVLATDIRIGALNQSQKRAARLGLDGLATAVLDDSQRLPDAAPFDAVLVDAPCTGAGTWRRSPDARWRLTSDRLAELNRTQDALLNQASSAVKVGGQLVYATCSWLVQENEQRIRVFLTSHPEFELRQQTLLGAPTEDADTLFVAVMIRR